MLEYQLSKGYTLKGFSKLTNLLILLCLLASPQLFAQSGAAQRAVESNNKQEVVIYTESQYRPYSYIEDAKLTGIYVEFIDELNRRLVDYDIKLFAQPWSEIKRDFRKGIGFALLGAYFVPSEAEYLYPYTTALHQEEVVVVCAASAPSDKAQDSRIFPQDYKGSIVANVKAYDTWSRDALRGGEFSNYLRFFEVPSVDIGLKMLAKGRVDCALTERLAYVASLQHLSSVGEYLPETDIKPEIVAVLNRENVYLTFLEAAYYSDEYPWASDFKKQFDIEAANIRQEGKFEEIIARFVSNKGQ